MATARQHVEEIRRVKFSIGAKEANPLTEDLHQAVKNLSAELYAKDVHFLMELIQNNRKRGYIGEKGIGFKSVFLITRQPFIFSNGYQICFNESPCPECNVGYIVPQWVDGHQILSEVKRIHGSNSNLPTTTILLPLKPDKVKPVKQQLSSVHPELLLFLSKIKKLSVREDNIAGPTSNTVTAISISSETNFVTRKNIDAESFLLHLSANDEGDRECSYYMWRQRFRVRPENMVEKRAEVEEYVITLAFPNGKRLQRGSSNSPGIYAFLPTEMVTNFPFIIQADFLLGSSRETILLDCKWNLGILNCVPTAFVNAFISLVKEKENAPVSILPRMFGFLPITSSPYALLNSVRDQIQSKLMEESIIPCESYTQQKFFHKPREVGRLKPGFWDLLEMARKQGVCLDSISTHGKYILSSAFDDVANNDFLSFLKVGFVDDDWYVKCVRSSNLVLGGGEDLYLELLLFVAENWSSFSRTSLVDIPFIKYVGAQFKLSVCKINEVPQKQVLLSQKSDLISWLIDWNGEFLGVCNQFFLPKSTQSEIFSHSKSKMIWDWLRKEAKVSSVSVNDYARNLCKVLGSDRKRVVAYAHFFHQSFEKSYLSATEVNDAAHSMPLVNNYGQVIVKRQGVVVPANGSRWVQLVGSNPWREEGYVELGEDYLFSGNYAGVFTREKELLQFLESHVAALDVPDLPPPNAQIPSFYSLLTKENALLLLEWIRNVKAKRRQMPSKFLNCVKSGSWLRVSLGSSKPPSQSFLLTNSACKSLLQNGSILVDIPLVDQSFYGNEILKYKDELREAGVMSEFSEACQYIGNHLMSIAASFTLTRAHVFAILNFIRFLRDKLLPADDFVKQIKDKRWLRTSQGDRSPSESVLYDQKWKAASQISDIPFIDHEYYGEDINTFRMELELLGVVVGFRGHYKLIVDNLKSNCKYQSTEVVLLMLECMRHLSSSFDKLVRVLKDSMLLRTTNSGYKSPGECYLSDPSWGSLLQIFNSFSIIDTQFYGGQPILSFRDELARIGVLVNFEEATKAFARVFRQKASLSSINKDNVLSFLANYKKLKEDGFHFHSDLKNCLQEVKWLRTRLTDCRAPKDVILFSPEWMPVSSISLLPFVDDSENYYGKAIHKYEDLLKTMGVIVSLESGAKLVASFLRLPQDPSVITAAAVCSLLECIRTLLISVSKESFDTLSKKASGVWIKTHVGYRSPDKCLLFGSDWASSLSCKDGPFIDETFYGPGISSYSKELNALGVVVEKKNGCSLLASHLSTQTDFTAIKQIYSYLSEMKWKPKDEVADLKIWIPNEGIWVNSDECVLHDKDVLFGGQLYILDTYYERNLLNFFSYALGVKTHPSLDDYCKLWLNWEDSGHLLSSDECIAFWVFVAKHWSSVTQKVLSEIFRKLPVMSEGSDKILLTDKYDVFVGDDLCLKHLFEKSASQPLFVWYPQPSLISLPRNHLLDIYGKIGVRNLSESVEISKVSACDVEGVEVNPRDVFINQGLFKLILGFLAGLQIEVPKRHEAVNGLLKISVIETPTPITVGYNLRLKSGEIINVDARRLVRWEKEKSEFYMHKLDKTGGRKHVLECATYFSQVISEGILWDDKEDHIQQLAELVKIGFILEFDEEAVGFLMKTKNLQIFLEDEEFLSSAFSS